MHGNDTKRNVIDKHKDFMLNKIFSQLNFKDNNSFRCTYKMIRGTQSEVRCPNKFAGIVFVLMFTANCFLFTTKTFVFF